MAGELQHADPKKESIIQVIPLHFESAYGSWCVFPVEKYALLVSVEG
jgi:hypothetical protein